MTDRAVIFTGLIRNEDKFMEFLELFGSDYENDRPQLYLSTWAGELEKYKQVALRLEKLGAKIFEQIPPDLVLPGHALHQIVSLDIVLSFIEPNTYIFKSRPDFADFKLYKAFMSSEPEPVVDNFLKSTAPQYKISVTGFSLAHPFYINDMHFSGISSDLKFIINLPFISLTRYQKIQAEQLLWGGTVIPKFRVLDIYFRANQGLIRSQQEAAWNSRLLSQCQCFHYVLSAYYLIINSWFSTFYNSEGQNICTENLNLEDLLWSNFTSPSIYHNPLFHTNWSWDISVLRKIINKSYATSEFGCYVKKAIEQLESQNNPEKYMSKEIISSAQEYSLSTREINSFKDKTLQRSENLYFIDSGSPDWDQRKGDEQFIKNLELEINFLRRENDSLRKSL